MALFVKSQDLWMYVMLGYVKSYLDKTRNMQTLHSLKVVSVRLCNIYIRLLLPFIDVWILLVPFSRLAQHFQCCDILGQLSRFTYIGQLLRVLRKTWSVPPA